MQCYNPVNLKNVPGYESGLVVPCGKCLACRIKQRAEWTLRILHELHTNQYEGCFLTLTYNDKNLPNNGSLVKKDLQKFFKRLRKRIYPKKIKYFACGEYGEKSERPHYHAIIFGLDNVLTTQEACEDVWKYGFIYLGNAEPDSIRYVAQYIDKKFSGDKEKEVYYDRKREPVFRLLSIGLGGDYAVSNADQIKNNLFISMFGVKMSVPRYYVRKLDIDREKLKERAIKNEIDQNGKVFGLFHDMSDLWKMALEDITLNNNYNLHDEIIEQTWKKEAYKKQSQKNKEKAVELRELKRTRRKI